MIKPYKFIVTPHHQLHENVIAFFDRIEFETGEYSIKYFDESFYEKIIKPHPQILDKKFNKIYNILKKWPQENRTKFCKEIRDSNNIEEICKKAIQPLSKQSLPNDLKNEIHELFINLYEKVLKGKNSESVYGNLQAHFKLFKSEPNDFVKCPTCGLYPVKSKEESRDQYDHYLSKDIYPLSSINFKNLVPICSECNSILVKGTTDVLIITENRKIFYPFDESHTGIKITSKLLNDNATIDNLEFVFYYEGDNDVKEEIESWKIIFKINDRHTKRAKGLALKWYQRYWEFLNKPKYSKYSLDEKKDLYYDISDDDDLEVIKIPVILALENSSMAKANLEAKFYSMNFS